ncbi:hypothetical protein CY35_03G046000 [Sphagnum magellanicum]|nr:hypothetical protein CY35_03G046000 [Sphagnum magellanicum]
MAAARAGRVLRQQGGQLRGLLPVGSLFSGAQGCASWQTTIQFSPAVVGSTKAASISSLWRINSHVSSQGIGAWYQQRAGIKVAGEDPDTHDDFKPVERDAESAPSVHETIQKDIKENPVMVYMKGVPEAPQCGFSATVVRILAEHGVKYKSRNVLVDQELRDGIKSFSKWPTVPQVYVAGEFVGGSDILISMHRSGELQEMLKGLEKES